jgi:hypothetical protein
MSRLVTRRWAIVGILALAWTVGACADPVPHAEMKLRVDEFAIDLAPGSSDEGTVKMFVDNVGKLEHTLVFVRAKTVSELPLAADGSVDLSKVQVADQLKNPFGPGKYRIAPEFFPGPIVVFCNLVTKGADGQPVSHFQKGMVAQLTIRDTGD